MNDFPLVSFRRCHSFRPIARSPSERRLMITTLPMSGSGSGPSTHANNIFNSFISPDEIWNRVCAIGSRPLKHFSLQFVRLHGKTRSLVGLADFNILPHPLSQPPVHFLSIHTSDNMAIKIEQPDEVKLEKRESSDSEQFSTKSSPTKQRKTQPNPERWTDEESKLLVALRQSGHSFG